ncbi:hypothetical protein ACP70R_032741 [Stipagrostis hirtigluma subsp. patula]
MAPGTSRLTMSCDIPEEVICYTIFSRLPLKLVMCMKTLSKHCYRQLTSDTKFAAEQARLCPSSPALIHIGCLPKPRDSYKYSLDVLSSTPAIVGVPSSGLDFLGFGKDTGHFDLLASSNGLLCIRYIPFYRGPLTPPKSILIANPATQQAQPIPGATQHILKNLPVGLVFDPPEESSSIGHNFMIVQAISFALTDDNLVDFCFVIFSSLTGRWVMSDTVIRANVEKRCNKVVYASGVLYWDYQPNMFWFDVKGNATGVIKMPGKLQGFTSEECDRHNIDVSDNGMLMVTTVNKDGFAVYGLVKKDAHYWELNHKKGWKEIMEMTGDGFQFYHSIMKLRGGCQSKFYERWFVRPLGLESGRWIYLGVRLKWKTPDRVLCYDMVTGKVADIGKELGRDFHMSTVFGYRNSMASLPPIHVPVMEDGICDGKPGGCICAVGRSED